MQERNTYPTNNKSAKHKNKTYFTFLIKCLPYINVLKHIVLYVTWDIWEEIISIYVKAHSIYSLYILLYTELVNKIFCSRLSAFIRK